MSLDKYALLAAQEATVTGDLSQAHEFEGNRIIEAGDYYGAMVHYADIGQQADEYKGEFKGYVPVFKTGIALYEFNADTGEFEFIKIQYDNFGTRVKLNPKAAYMKIMNAFKTAKDTNIKHFAQFFGKPKLFSVSVSKDGKYNNIDLQTVKDGINPMTRKPVELPPVPAEKMCMFLWNNPILEEFNKLNDKTKEQILNAHNYHGSAVEQMILNGGDKLILPTAKEDDFDNGSEAYDVPEPKQEAPKVARSVPQMPVSPDDFDDDIPF